ncbi:MAG TPA: hypothetical protein VGD60_15590 [Candidatus Acidoferrales bacterium]
MRSKLAYGVTLAAAAFCLSGCSYFRPTGPCFGTGCPSHTAGQSGQYKVGQGPKAAAATATHATQTAAPPQKTAGPSSGFAAARDKIARVFSK